MNVKCISTTFQVGGGYVVVFGILLCHALVPLIPFHECLNSISYINIVADKVHSVMLIIYPYDDDYIQQDKSSCHTAGIVQDWF